MNLIDGAMESDRTEIKELRSFGVLVGGIIAGVFGILIPLLRGGALNLAFYATGSLLILAALGAPGMLRPLHAAWMKLGHILGWINTRIILTFFFFCILLPAGIIMRLAGKDPMNRKFDPEARSYRTASRIPASVHFERPF